MTVKTMLAGIAIAAIAATAPALAQTHAGHEAHGNMAGHAAGGHKMVGEADKKKMESCNAMSHADAMKDAACAALMKAHPDMMHHMPAKAPARSM